MDTNQNTHLYGAKLHGIYPWQEFSPNIEGKEKLEIVRITLSTPITIQFAEDNHSSIYSILATEAVKSEDFLSRLSHDDRLTVETWGNRKQRVPRYVVNNTLNRADWYQVGMDVDRPEGGRLLGSPLSQKFIDKSLAVHALEQIRKQHPDARIGGYYVEDHGEVYIQDMKEIYAQDELYREKHGL